MLGFYRAITGLSGPLLRMLLARRVRAGREDPARLNERMGVPVRPRPDGMLIWLHAASVGEAQSALILIEGVLRQDTDVQVMVTTGTVTSAVQMADKLPDRAFHQFIPLDHPAWVWRFLGHWRPDAALWMESELWPNMLGELRTRKIPAALVNARLSDRSFGKWRRFGNGLRNILKNFDFILTQTKNDTDRFQRFYTGEIITTGNLKYSATPLPCNERDLQAMREAAQDRPLVVYASTHAGEEGMAMRMHAQLEPSFPGLLSIVIPRHPARGEEIVALDRTAVLRGDSKRLPDADTGVYIADTLGELGLFYRLSDIVYIGRSMSEDGGGGHNPIEAAQLNCAILHGPNVQNLQEIYDDLGAAAIAAQDEAALEKALAELLSDPGKVAKHAKDAIDFALVKTHIVDRVLEHVQPVLAGLRK